MDSEGLAWPAVWRYIERFYIASFGELCGGTPLSLQLLAVMEEELWIRPEHMKGVFRQFRDPKLLADSMQDHVRYSGDGSSPLWTHVPKTVAVVATEPGTGSKKKKGCPLCLSTGHKYLFGNYGHTNQPITQACPQRQSDGQVCGGMHAFSGPLKTPCRLGGNIRNE